MKKKELVKLLKDIEQAGGMTIDASTGRPVKFDKGYMVADDTGIISNDIDEIMYFIKYKTNKFVGF